MDIDVPRYLLQTVDHTVIESHDGTACLMWERGNGHTYLKSQLHFSLEAAR